VTTTQPGGGLGVGIGDDGGLGIGIGDGGGLGVGIGDGVGLGLGVRQRIGCGFTEHGCGWAETVWFDLMARAPAPTRSSGRAASRRRLMGLNVAR
jgi:hypothetical protein